MAGIRFKKRESKTLLKLAIEEKTSAKASKRKMDWQFIADKLNRKHNNGRTAKGCFYYWTRHKLEASRTGKEPVRFARPKTNSKYEPVTNARSFWLSAIDEEGNVVFSLLVNNTPANVSRMLTEGCYNLNQFEVVNG